MYQLVPVLNHLEQIDLWVSGNISPRPAAMHVDVGMNRLGLSEAHWAAAAKMMPRPSRLLAHLACGDEDSPLNAQQLEIFERASKLWPGAPRSLSATGGAYLGKAYHFDEVRPGIGLYGGGPKPAEGSPSHTVVTLTAPVLQVRDIKKGTTVGYGATWMADADTTLATVGLGYADGFLRSASNRGKAFVAGEKRPIVGRISMDLIVVDVTGLSVSPGDDIEFLGPNMPLSEVAGAMGTIDYEILTRLGSRFERVYVGGHDGDPRRGLGAPARPILLRPFAMIGQTVIGAFREVGRIAVFSGGVLAACVTPVIYLREVLRQCMKVGLYFTARRRPDGGFHRRSFGAQHLYGRLALQRRTVRAEHRRAWHHARAGRCWPASCWGRQRGHRGRDRRDAGHRTNRRAADIVREARALSLRPRA